MTGIPLSLYIHFPWCLRKCPYCDFNSYSLPEPRAPLELYFDKLLIDLENEATRQGGRQINSIYFGGGTPSLLPPDKIKKIIERSRELFYFAPDIEITLEANPGTINLESCKGFKAAGINRISLGVQSFNDELLKNIGRIHDACIAQDAITAIKKAKFCNFNLDIMFGLPGQSTADALSDLKKALDFQPLHLSWYQLTLEPKTLFAHSPPLLPKNEDIWDIQQAGQNLLEQAGLSQYEVSAYSRPGYECRHNINYWQYGDYIGIGAGAHGKITFQDCEIKRHAKISDPMKYLQAQGTLIANEKIIIAEERPFEFMLNALRLYQPITHELFLERTKVEIGVISKELQSACDLGLLELQNDKIITTSKGKNFLNNLLEIFL